MLVFFSSYFVLTTPAHFSAPKAQCVAYMEDRGPGKRCGNKWRVSEEDIHHIGTLQVDCENANEPEQRAGILGELATLCLCNRHQKGEEAAAYQWENEIQSRASNSHLIRLVTSQPQRRREDFTIDFKRYGRQEMKELSRDEEDLPSLLEHGIQNTEDVSEHTKEVDRKASNYLIDRLEQSRKAKKSKRTPSSFLYVFSHHAAKGFYKVGSGNGRARIRQHEACYPGLVVQCLIFCPNASLFENLVHAEFSADRYYHICDYHGTPKEHREWFKVPLADILNSVTAWSAFSQVFYSENIWISRQEPILCLPGSSQDPARWTKWARWRAEEWRRQSTLAAKARSRQDLGHQYPVETKTPVRQRHPRSGNDPYYSSSPPELTPSSGLGSPDSGCDGPPTPTPSTRAQRGRHYLLKGVGPVDASQGSTASFSTAATLIQDGWEPTFAEHSPTEPGDVFWYSEPNKKSPSKENELKYLNFAGVTVNIEGASSDDPLDAAERMMRTLFV